MGEPTHTLVHRWMPKPLPPRKQCMGWYAPTQLSHYTARMQQSPSRIGANQPNTLIHRSMPKPLPPRNECFRTSPSSLLPATCLPNELISVCVPLVFWLIMILLLHFTLLIAAAAADRWIGELERLKAVPESRGGCWVGLQQTTKTCLFWSKKPPPSKSGELRRTLPDTFVLASSSSSSSSSFFLLLLLHHINI